MKPEDFKDALCRYLATSDENQTSFAKQVGTSQSQVSSWTKGDFKRVSPHVKTAMRIIEKYNNEKIEGELPPKVILGAVKKVWNGSEAHARAIAKVIESLAEMRC